MGSLKAWLERQLEHSSLVPPSVATALRARSSSCFRTAPGLVLRQRFSAKAFRPAAAALLLLSAIFAIGASSASLAQPSIGATLDDNVPGGTYRQDGDTLNYTTVITNSGAGGATGTTLTSPAPADTTLVPGSVHASPLANHDAYNAVGNTKLYVGVSVPAGEPALASASAALFANDTTITDSTLFVSNTNPGSGSVSVNSDGTFVYTPNAGFTGVDSFTYTTRNSVDATLTDTGTVTVTVSNLVWYVNNAAGGGGNGTSTSPFNSLASLNSGGDVDGPNAFIYVYRGTGAAYTGGLPLESGQVLTSETNALVVGGNTLRAAQAVAVPTLSHTTGSTVTLSTGNTIDGFSITNSAGNGISGSAIGTTAIADIAVSVTGGTALNATTSGTLTVAGSANTLSSTNGTALNVNAVTIGAGGLNFQSVSKNGGSSPGIGLANTGSTAGLTVAGAGTTDDSGGIIQNTGAASGVVLTNTRFTNLSKVTIGDATTTPNTGNGPINFTPSIGAFGISMSNADDTTLNNVTIAKTENSGIDGTGVTNLTISNSEILRAGDDNEENGLSFDDFAGGTENNLDGTVIIQSTVIDAYSEDGIVVENFTGTLNLTLNAVTIGRNKFETGEVGGLNPFGEQGIQARADGNSNMTITIGVTSLFDAVDGNGIFVVSEGAGTVNVAVTDTIVQNSDALGIVFFGGSGDHTNTLNSKLNFDIIGDWPGGSSGVTTSSVMVTGTNSTGISIQPNGNSSMNGTVKGVIVNGSTIGRGIEVLGDDASDAVVALDNNKVSNSAFNGIFANTADYGRLDIHIRNNNVSAPLDATPPSGLAVHGIEINPVPRAMGDPGDFATITTLDISSNISAGNAASVGAGYRLRQRGPDVTFNLERLPGNQTTTPPVVTFIEGQNTSGNASVSIVAGTQYTAVVDGAALDPHTPPAP